jgi:hypothetical protein
MSNKAERIPLRTSIVTVGAAQWPSIVSQNLNDGFEIEAYSTCWTGLELMHSAVFIEWSQPYV